MAKIILGFAGEIASGKGTAAKYVKEKYGAKTYQFSGSLRDILDRLYLEQKRENFAKLSEALRKIFGEDIMSKVMKEDLGRAQEEIIALEGIRRLDDIKYIRELPEFKFVYVEASLETRYGRIVKRGENVDDAQKTFEEFKKDHELETETQIRDLKNHADFVLDNNGAPEKLYEQIDSILAKL
ncbi:MAG TPA: hypothetical protein DIT25_02880 [Candidatus Moranbacteria bacterium]|nr:hypothetical protein [Candidatus Moranbacteria bacterium]